jgi:UDP-N-acetylglucosamine--N-acetylmuramyl-(pentapeptide) pyrophosphoryl-undecaprenol N-acetylglucosamine transferase
LKIAAAKKIPTVIQEQNSYPGISTRKLATDAKRVYLGFAEAERHLKSCGQVITTGNPVRRAVLGGDRSEALKAFGLDPEKKTILVLGGSQGARSVNNAVLRSLESSGSWGTGLPGGYQLIWQSGKRDYKDVIAKAGDKVNPHALFPFEDRMNLVYAAADLVIARAGALTLAELQACNIPSILIPYPFAAGDHQRKNAQQFLDAGFARVIDPAELDGVDLLKTAVNLIESGKVDDMSCALEKANAGQKPAVDIIAEDIINLLEQQQRQEETIGA